jgi:hypothetical protein
VNRQNLKFKNLNTHYRPGLALELNPRRKIVSLATSCSNDADDVWEQTQINIGKETLERGKGANKSSENQASEHGDLFYRGSVPKNLVSVEEATKAGSISTISLSQTVT